MLALEHSDLLERVQFAYLERLQELLEQRKNVASGKMAVKMTALAPPISDVDMEHRFPGSIDEFRKLSEYPAAQLRVAKYLDARSDDARKDIFNAEGSQWKAGDTAVLKRAYFEHVSSSTCCGLKPLSLALNSPSQSAFRAEVKGIISKAVDIPPLQPSAEIT